MKIVKLLVAVLASAGVLAGCGGGSTFSPAPTPGTQNVAKINVATSVATIAADGSTTATITGTLLDSSNNTVKGTTVTFASSAGVLAVTSATSDASGLVTGTLSAGTAAAGTSITVTVSSGNISGKVVVAVGTTSRTLTLTTNQTQIPSDGSKLATITALVRDGNNNAVQGAAVSWATTSGILSNEVLLTDANGLATAVLGNANDPTNRTITVSASLSGGTPVTLPINVSGTVLSVTGPAAIVTGNAATYTIQLSNSAGAGIPNQAVTVASALGNTLSAPSVNTNATGQATVTLTAKTSGSDNLTVTALGLSAHQPISVSGQSFAFTSPAPAPAAPQNVNLNTTYTAVVNWSSNGTPVVNSPVTFATTRGTLSANTVNTDASGNASVTITSANAGPGILTASATGVTAQAQVEFIATQPATITLQPSLKAVPTQGSSTILAVVRDPAGNLVEGQAVKFVLQDITNGVLSTGQAVTNAQGIAQTVYTASSTSSAKDGVSITASVLSAPAVTATTTLTVGGQTVFLSLGTGNTVNEYSQAEYSQNWAVRAIDAQGATVPNVQVTIAITSVSYGKGFWCVPGTTFPQSSPYSCATTGSVWVLASPYTSCASEDVNNNGILDPGEDFNGNGKLDPGSVASISPGSGSTDPTGLLPFTLYYPKDHAEWVTVQISASAIVNGTQATTSTTVTLPIAAADINNLQVTPPGGTSPYGIATSCANPN